jgi:aldehyde:ferredoxin oxidoreductase
MDCNGEKVIAKQKRRYGCWRCPIACGGVMKAGDGEYQYPEGAHKPEYETMPCSAAISATTTSIR